MRSMGSALKLLIVLSFAVIANVQPTRGQDAVVDLRRTHERAVFAMVSINVRTRRGVTTGTGWLLQQSAAFAFLIHARVIEEELNNIAGRARR